MNVNRARLRLNFLGYLLICYLVLTTFTSFALLGMSQLNIGLHFSSFSTAFIFCLIIWALYPLCFAIELLFGMSYLRIKKNMSKGLSIFINKTVLAFCLATCISFVIDVVSYAHFTWFEIALVALLFIVIVEQFLEFMLIVIKSIEKQNSKTKNSGK